MQLFNADCLEKLKELGDNTIDAVVTDPPYELGFMGKSWDNTGVAYNPALWKEVLRVLKPGGHLLSFGGSRTYHRMACAIEDAGFEIRDQIMWVYGSGFPKSLNIGKAVDKLQGNEREWVGINPNKASEEAEIASAGKCQSSRTTHPDITKGTSAWEGYGTALKPAHEPIVLARKPLSEKTVAENCLKWGVGGLAIDECRVGHNEPEWHTKRNPRQDDTTFNNKTCGFNSENTTLASANPSGRFPANFIHDGSDEVVELFPNVKGQYGGKGRAANSKSGKYGWNNINKDVNNKGATQGITDEGSAARFFYTPKASKRERGEGNNHPTVKSLMLMKYLITLISREGHTVLDPFMGSGTTGIACKELGRDFIGIEREAEYLEIAKRRIGNVASTEL
jgi:DNA modification methylase